jgi:small-conductance mechanosensitive channel
MLDLMGTFQERILSNGTARLLDLGIAFVLVFVLYILIKLLVKKVENRIMGHALDVTSYTKKMATLVGNILFIVLMMFNVLVAFEVMGINTAILI